MARYGLFVGVNDYADSENIRALRFAVEDARRVDRFFHACGFEVQSLMDSESTYSAIQGCLHDLSCRLQPGDLFLFYFSGHGFQWGMPGEQRQYILARDANLWALQHGAEGGAIPLGFIRECTSGTGLNRAIILDACRTPLSPGSKGNSATEEHVAARDIRTQVQSAKGSPLIVVCSSRPGALAHEHGALRGGFFTTAMLEVFQQLQTRGEPIAFTTSITTAITEKMQLLAVQTNFNPQEVRDFWIEGDAGTVELVPRQSVRPVKAASQPVVQEVDPEKVKVKEWQVDELKIEVERVEIEHPETPGLPPVPEAILMLRGEIKGLEQVISELQKGTHPSLKQAQQTIREAEEQVKTFEEDLAAHEVPMQKTVRTKLITEVNKGRTNQVSNLCMLAPDIPTRTLLPYVARLRNVRRAQLAHKLARQGFEEAIKNKVSELNSRIKSKQYELTKLEEEDLNVVFKSIWPDFQSMINKELLVVWPVLEDQLQIRGYRWSPLILLKKAEVFLKPMELSPDQARDIQRTNARILGIPIERELTCGSDFRMKMILIPAGKFLMGSLGGEYGRSDDEGPQHIVWISKPFYMGIYPVTQIQYQTVMGSNPSQLKSDQCPVNCVSWNNAVAFCNKLSEFSGKSLRLPSEAEWEYACRSGGTNRFNFDDNDIQLDEIAWYCNNSTGKTHPAGQKKSNCWGLYDMHGNVWEWCQDRYRKDYYAQSPVIDPQGPSTGNDRVLRGGSWDDQPEHCRSADRYRSNPISQNGYFGFRVVMDL